MTFIPGLIGGRQRVRRPALAAAGNSYVVPALVDLRPQLLSSSDQGPTPQCVAYAVAGLIEFNAWKYAGIVRQIDPGPIYRRAKELDGLPADTAGTTLEAGLQAAQDLGHFSPAGVANLREVYTLEEVQQALHRHGVVLGAFTISQGWMKQDDAGWIAGGGAALGGHAVLICGYEATGDEAFVSLQNSWGTAQGWRGFNRLPAAAFKDQFNYGLVLKEG